MKRTLFMVDAFEKPINMVMHCSDSIEPFCCRRREEFIVLIKGYSAQINIIKTCEVGEVMCNGSHQIISKLYNR